MTKAGDGGWVGPGGPFLLCRRRRQAGAGGGEASAGGEAGAGGGEAGAGSGEANAGGGEANAGGGEAGAGSGECLRHDVYSWLLRALSRVQLGQKKQSTHLVEWEKKAQPESCVQAPWQRSAVEA